MAPHTNMQHSVTSIVYAASLQLLTWVTRTSLMSLVKPKLFLLWQVKMFGHGKGVLRQEENPKVLAVSEQVSSSETRPKTSTSETWPNLWLSHFGCMAKHRDRPSAARPEVGVIYEWCYEQVGLKSTACNHWKGYLVKSVCDLWFSLWCFQFLYLKLCG